VSELQVVCSEQCIRSAVERLACEIRSDYQDKNPLLIGVLKGVFVFMADLVRSLNMPLEVEFVRLSSYGYGRTESSGDVKVIHGLESGIEGRHVLVVEDIVDEGRTLDHLLRYLNEQKPASLKVCALFNKPSRRQVPVNIDYLGLTIPNVFVVGCGLDYDEKFRYFPDLRCLDD